jgi:hypothetical protein
VVSGESSGSTLHHSLHTIDHTHPEPMKERKSFLLRMDPAIYEALEGWAEQELRSLNGQIEYLLKEAVAKRRKALQETSEKHEKPSEKKG